MGGGYIYTYYYLSTRSGYEITKYTLNVSYRLIFFFYWYTFYSLKVFIAITTLCHLSWIASIASFQLLSKFLKLFPPRRPITGLFPWGFHSIAVHYPNRSFVFSSRHCAINRTILTLCCLSFNEAGDASFQTLIIMVMYRIKYDWWLT